MVNTKLYNRPTLHDARCWKVERIAMKKKGGIGQETTWTFASNRKFALTPLPLTPFFIYSHWTRRPHKFWYQKNSDWKSENSAVFMSCWCLYNRPASHYGHCFFEPIPNKFIPYHAYILQVVECGIMRSKDDFLRHFPGWIQLSRQFHVGLHNQRDRPGKLFNKPWHYVHWSLWTPEISDYVKLCPSDVCIEKKKPTHLHLVEEMNSLRYRQEERFLKRTMFFTNSGFGSNH